MDTNLQPPLRIQTTSTTAITSDVAKNHLARFLSDYETRARSSGGEDKSHKSQLTKLMKALDNETSNTKAF